MTTGRDGRPPVRRRQAAAAGRVVLCSMAKPARPGAPQPRAPAHLRLAHVATIAANSCSAGIFADHRPTPTHRRSAPDASIAAVSRGRHGAIDCPAVWPPSIFADHRCLASWRRRWKTLPPVPTTTYSLFGMSLEELQMKVRETLYGRSDGPLIIEDERIAADGTPAHPVGSAGGQHVVGRGTCGATSSSAGITAPRCPSCLLPLKAKPGGRIDE
jgi:hypothetical protein